MAKSITEYIADSNELSGKASDCNRALAFAGIATVWIFKRDTLEWPIIPKLLIWALCFFALSLLFDLLQYFISSVVWKIYSLILEKKYNDDDNVGRHGHKWVTPLYVIYVLKILFAIIGWGLVVGFLLSIV